MSMLLYIIYNASLLEITDNDEHEDALGYVDDIALLAIGGDFVETTARLKNMMEKQEGGLEWSEQHNSHFEISKSAILHLSRKTTLDLEVDNHRIPLYRPALMVNGQIIKEVSSYKYLGVQIDAQLRWKEQAQQAIANTTKWLLQFRRLTRPSSGTCSKLMRQLYLAVALPKITYGLDIWYTPPNKRAVKRWLLDYSGQPQKSNQNHTHTKSIKRVLCHKTSKSRIGVWYIRCIDLTLCSCFNVQ